MQDWIRELDGVDFGAGVHSQGYQDLLLETIFANIGTINPTPFCVEFGFDADELTGGCGSNVAHLVTDMGWDSLLLDGGNANPAINLHQRFLTPDNICDIFAEHGVPREPEYISIDVDSADLWLFDALAGQYRAMVYTVEYNCHFPLDAAITFPNDPDERWEGDRGYGASLKALNLVAEKHGYSLLWVVPLLDAVFIRNDLIDDGTAECRFPLEKWRDATGLVLHPPLRRQCRAAMFLDYEVYLNTGGDVAASRRSAAPVCRKHLAMSFSEAARQRISRALPEGLKNAMRKVRQPSP